MHTLLRCVLFTLLFMFLARHVQARTIDAASCSVADISAALALAATNDTVSVPAGNCSWTTTLTLSKSVSLVGKGPGATKISTDAATGYIQVANGTNDWKISGFSFSTATNSWYAIYVSQYASNSNKNWRITNCEFRGYHYSIYAFGTLVGLIDNNRFFGGGVSILGSQSTSWSTPSNLGGSEFVFIEDNRFSDVGALTPLLHVVYAGWGARVVVRYNEILSEDTDGLYDGISGAVDAHGYGHGSSVRGTRIYEIYKNRFATGYKGGSSAEALFLRAGTGVVFDNIFDSTKSPYGFGAMLLTDYRIRTSSVGTDTATLSSSCSTSALCYPTYFRLLYSGSDVFAEGQVVSGGTSGATASILGIGPSANYLYFLAITKGPFTAGEDLLVGGVKKSTAAAASEQQKGEGYPCCDQVGRGVNNTGEPFYFWNNKDQNGNLVTPVVQTGTTAGYITENVDFINQAKSGYVSYQYPHPLARLAAPTLHEPAVP